MRLNDEPEQGPSAAGSGTRGSPRPSDRHGRPGASADDQRIVTEWRSTGIDGAGWTDRQERRGLTRIGIDRGAEPQAVRVISAPFMPDEPGLVDARRSSCCDGLEMIQGLLGRSVKPPAQRFTRTDIPAGQGHSQRSSDVVAIAPLVTLTKRSSSHLRTSPSSLGSTT